MKVRIDFPFTAQFEVRDPGSNSREVRTYALHDYLVNCGMELGHPVEDFSVTGFNAEDNGEFWTIKADKT